MGAAAARQVRRRQPATVTQAAGVGGRRGGGTGVELSGRRGEIQAAGRRAGRRGRRWAGRARYGLAGLRRRLAAQDWAAVAARTRPVGLRENLGEITYL